MRLQAQGITLEQFFEFTGQDPDGWVADMREAVGRFLDEGPDNAAWAPDG